MQAPGRARFDAGRLKPRPDAVGAQRALIYLLGNGVKFRDVEGTPRHAVLAANALILLEIDDAIDALHDGAVGRAGLQTAWLCAVHALGLTPPPHHGTLF